MKNEDQGDLRSETTEHPNADQDDADAYDEAFSFAGGTVARKGRFLVWEAHRTKEEHTAMLATMVANTEKFSRLIEDEIQELDQIILRYNPIDLIGNIGFANAITNPETYKEYAHQGKPAFVEYITLLYLTHPLEQLRWASSELVDGAVVQNMQERLEKLFVQTLWEIMINDIKPQEETYPDILAELRFRTLAHSLVVRYPAYHDHLTELLTGVLAETNQDLVEVLGFSIQDALLLSDAVPNLITRRLRTRYRQALVLERSLRKAVEKYRRKKQFTKGLPRELVRELAAIPPKLLRPRLQHVAAAMTFSGLTRVLSFTAADLASAANVSLDSATAFLAKLSLFFGSVDSRYRRPSPTHPLTSRPFIRIGGRFFCPLPQMVVWSLRPAIESFLQPSSNERVTENARYWKRYEKSRSHYLEQATLQCFQRALPCAQVYQNLKYTIQQPDGSVKIAELDGLVVFDTVVFLVEVKAGTVSPPARRGARHLIKEELRELVEHAYLQGLRAKRYIQQTDFPRFTAEDGTAVSIQKDRIDQVFLVAVTLEALDAFVTDLYQLQEIGLFVDGDLPWAVSLTDLRVISELVEFPCQFVHYLLRRQKLNEIRKNSANDELDWFGHYLLEGLYFENMVETNAIDRMNLLSYTTAIDSYYLYKMEIRRTPAEIPRQQMPALLRLLLQSLEDQRPHGYIRAGCALLDMDGKTREEFVHGIEQLKAKTRSDQCLHDLTLVFSDAKLGITCMFATPSKFGELQTRLPSYCALKKYQTKSDTWVGIGIDVCAKAPLQALLTVREAWREDVALDELVRRVFP
jgi:hypothetical protein